MSDYDTVEDGKLYRIHFRRRPVSATTPMIWAHAAKWVFRQTPKPRYGNGEGGFTGFEVETRRTPETARRTLEKATGKPWEAIVLWSRPAKPGEGEGPEKGENPWNNGWPVSDRPID